jgi:hypothetical protein
MSISIRLNRAEQAVLAVILASPAWGLEICEKTGLGTGSVYPALDRLMKAGLVTDKWEDPPPGSTLSCRYYYPADEANGILPAPAPAAVKEKL